MRESRRMPELARFFGIRITMVYEDHAPPHFHAEYAGMEAHFAIASGEIIAGNLSPRAARLVREWLELHRSELEENWQRRTQRQPLKPIAPLP